MAKKRWVQPPLPTVGALDAFLPDAACVAPTAETSDETRARAGRRADRHGKALEAWTRSQFDAAVLAEVLVWFTKIETPITQVRVRKLVEGRWSWTWELRWGAKAHADFVGCNAAGLCVAAECKSVEGTRLPLAQLARQQVHHLDQVNAAGGVALLVVEFRHVGRGTEAARQYVIPWACVPWQKARTALSIDEASVAAWAVQSAEMFERLRGR